MKQTEGRTYRYIRVYEALKQDIEAGRYQSGDLLPSEHAVGELHQVDRTTGRKPQQLLVDDGLVEKKAGKGTVVTAQEPRTTAAPARGALAGDAVAFLLPKSSRNDDRITQPFYSTLFYTIEKLCCEQSLRLIYSTLDNRDDFDAFIDSANITAAVFVSNVPEELLAKAVDKGIPSVLLNNYSPRLPSFLSDNFHGTYLACKYLLDQGHREIGLLKGIEDYYTTRERQSGCYAALYEYGITLRPQFVLQAEWDFESGCQATRSLLAAGGQLPTALLAFNDHLAAGAIRAIVQSGRRVPEDISVVGFDNLEQVKYITPPLTTVDINAPMIAEAAMQNLLLQMRGGRAYPVKILTPVSLVRRESVSPPREG